MDPRLRSRPDPGTTRLYGVDADLMKRIAVRSLNVLKVSYPRPQPQGWRGERDTHQGQSFARLLDIEVI